MRALATVLIIALFALAASALSAPPRIAQVLVTYDNAAQLRALQSAGFDMAHPAKNHVDLFLDETDLRRLDSMGFEYQIIHHDVTAFYQSRLSTLETMGGYKTLSEIYDYLDAMIADHGNIITARVSIGKTIEGRDIWAVKISDNPDIDESEPELLFTSLIHAREVITPEVLFHTMNYLTDNYGVLPEITQLVNSRQIWFVLVVNPDGYYYNELIAPEGGGLWRKNRRDNLDGTFGVDLNRNFGYMWGYDDIGSSPVTSSLTYRGTEPFSEPEARAMRDFIISHDFSIIVYYHAYSDLILWPWWYDYLLCDDDAVFRELGDSMTAYNGYDPSPAWDMYLANGVSLDWAYAEQELKKKNFEFCIEVGGWGDGYWPDPKKINHLVSENLPVNLFLCRAAGVVDGLCCDVMGDFNGDGRFDLLDIHSFIRFHITLDGTPPACLAEVDVSGAQIGVPDGSADILDIDYLIGYLLRADHPPLPPCPQGL